MVIQTEVEFTLPKGFLDDDGTLHRDGVMRLATAADEILPLKEASVQKNPAYLTVILLSRVVTRLGELSLVTPATIEQMFAADVAYLQDVYNDINNGSERGLGITCPNCDHHFDVERSGLGESLATPSI